MKFNHVGISVTDLDRSIAFYRDMLGLEPLGEPFPFAGPQFSEIMDIADVQGRMCMIARGNLWLELFEFANPAGKAKDGNYPVSDRGYSHFGVTVDDIEATYAKLQAAGVRLHGRLQTFNGGSMRAAYCRDPDGNVFEIMQPGSGTPTPGDDG
ncbi:MAG: VOC family protein [Sphingomonadales bacterium]|nr:VOC family protein [Sphingomonadales bacterium]